jgi:creatinine amidohydrolase
MSVLLAEKTWPDIEEAMRSGAVVVIPTGSVEQHGPHLPVQTDFYLAAEVAERSARRASEAGTGVLVAPPVWTGYSPHHMDYPGTVTLNAVTFMDVVTQVAASIWRHGFRKILFLNGHGGNANLINSAVQRLRFEEGVRVAAASYWAFVTDDIAEWRQSGPGGIDHACEMETSLMLAVRPDLVRPEEARDAAWFPHSNFLTGDIAIGAPVNVAWSFAELSSNGVLGDAGKGTAERGEVLLGLIVDRVVAFLEEFGGWDWDDPLSI